MGYSRIWAFDWYQGQWPWIIFNGVIGRYFALFCRIRRLGANYVKVVENRPLLSATKNLIVSNVWCGDILRGFWERIRWRWSPPVKSDLIDRLLRDGKRCEIGCKLIAYRSLIGSRIYGLSIGTLNDLERRTTADPRYLCGSWASCSHCST